MRLIEEGAGLCDTNGGSDMDLEQDTDIDDKLG